MQRAMRFLVVDDDPSNLIIAATILSLAGYEVVTCHDGFQAADHLFERQTAFDGVLLDVLMPKLDGRELARRIRETPATRDIAVVCVSAMVGPAEAKANLAAGCDVSLPKPYTRKQLLAAIDEAVAKRRPGTP